MKIFGSISETVALVDRKNGQAITLRPNQATTYTASRDIQYPAGDTDHVLTSATSTQTIQNKTLDNTNTVTLKDTLFTLQDDGDTSKQARFQLSGITTATTRTYTLPDASSTLVDLTSSQSLSNKTLANSTVATLQDANFTLQDDGDNTKQAKFQLSGITTGTTRTYTLPDASSTLVDLTSTQSLSNKTLTSPAFSGTAVGVVIKATTSFILEDPGAGTSTITLQAPTLSGSYTLTLPVDDGNSNQVLSTDGSGVLSWSTVATNPMTTLGDTTYGGSGGTPTRLAGSTDAIRRVYTQTGTGSVSTAPLWELPYETSNIRASEGAGTTTLTVSDLRHQVFNLSASRTVQLPTTSVKAGEVWHLAGITNFDLVVNASNGNALTVANSANMDATIQVGYVRVQALQDTPTTPAHWRVLEVYEEGSFTATYNSGVSSNVNNTIYYTRSNKRVHLTSFDDMNFTGTGSPASVATTGAPLPTRFRIPSGYNDHNGRTVVDTNNNGAQDTSPGRIEASSAGNFSANRGWNGGTWSNGSNSVNGGWNIIYFIK